MTLTELKKYFSYDGQDLTYKRHRHGLDKDCIGKVAGYVDGKGYRIVTFKQKKYKAHRLIWLYVHGHWPEQCIDHINRDKLDNRIENLRDCDHTQNMRNQGDVGVTRFGKRYKARLGQKHLGYFNNYKDALEVRRAAEREAWG